MAGEIQKNPKITPVTSAGSQKPGQTSLLRASTRILSINNNLAAIRKANAGPGAGGIITAEDGRMMFEEAGYLNEGEPATLVNISHALMQISITGKMTAKSMADYLRATSLILENIDVDDKSEIIVEAVVERLTTHIEQAEGDREEATNKIMEALQEMREIKDIFMESADAIIEEIGRNHEENVETIKARVGQLQTHHHHHPSPQQSPDPHDPTDPVTAHQNPTYAGALGRYTGNGTAQPTAMPSHVASVIERNNIRERQIMLDQDPTVDSHGLSNLCERDLMGKANIAMDLMGIEAEDAPKGIKFIGAQRMRNGGVLLQVNTCAAAKWLRKSDVMKSFVAHMGGESVYRERVYQTVAQFIPISFEPQTLTHLRRIEEYNDLGAGTVVEARYIKPVARRAPNQSMAHAIITFGSAEAANQAIGNGIYIEGKRIAVRKSLVEPKRCLKCQRVGVGHLAATCKETKETCPRCGEAHRAVDCVVDHNNLKCANCKEHGHGTADRQCPYFKSRLTQFLNRDPGSKFKYFPTNDSNSWERIDNDDIINNDRDATIMIRDIIGGGWSRPEERTENGGRGRLGGGRKGEGGGAPPIADKQKDTNNGERQGTLDGWRAKGGNREKERETQEDAGDAGGQGQSGRKESWEEQMARGVERRNERRDARKMRREQAAGEEEEGSGSDTPPNQGLRDTPPHDRI